MVWYNRGKWVIFDSTLEPEAPVNLVGDVIKVALMKTSYTVLVDTHDYFDDVTASEIVATGYTARGKALASKVITKNAGNNRIEFDAADLTWSPLGNGTNDTFDQIILLREPDTGATDANAVLIAHAVIPETTSNGGDVTLVWNSNGLLHGA